MHGLCKDLHIILQYITYVGGGGYAWIMQGFAYYFTIYYIRWGGGGGLCMDYARICVHDARPRTNVAGRLLSTECVNSTQLVEPVCLACQPCLKRTTGARLL